MTTWKQRIARWKEKEPTEESTGSGSIPLQISDGILLFMMTNSQQSRLGKQGMGCISCLEWPTTTNRYPVYHHNHTKSKKPLRPLPDSPR